MYVAVLKRILFKLCREMCKELVCSVAVLHLNVVATDLYEMFFNKVISDLLKLVCF